MKRLKISLAACAFAIAACGAVATNAASHKSSVTTETNYFWYDADGEPVSDGAAANPSITCLGGSHVCARGFLVEQTTPPTSGGDDIRTQP